MTATVTQTGTKFPFLPAAADTKSSRTDQGFAQMLQGQMSNRANQQASRGAYAAHTENASRAAASERAREPERPRQKTERAAENRRPDQPDAAAEAGAEQVRDSALEGSERTAPTAEATAAAADAAAQPATQQPAAPAEGATELAGLPAAIAALLAGTQDAAAEPPGDETSGLLPADISGDALDTALQNPAGNAARFGAEAEAARAAQLAAQTQGKTETLSGNERPAGITQAGELPNGLHFAAAVNHRSTAAQQPAVPQLPVNTPAGQAAFADDVGDRVMWMLGRAESKAELVLTPPTLGKVEVTINLSGDQTTAQFVVSSQAARDALEQALPKLREILQQSGISLGQTSVGTSGEQQAGGNEGGQRGRSGGGGGIEAAEGATAQRWIRQSDGMVDTFV